MIFYFVCYVVVGLFFGIAGTIHLARQDERVLLLSEFWIKPPVMGNMIILACVLAPLLGIATSLLQSGLWVFATLLELALGAMIARFFIPLAAMNMLTFLSVPSLILIFGALWGFWYL